jgi:hypothetical protein
MGFYCDILFDPSNSNPSYVGLNVLCGADTATVMDWKIYKFTYAGAGSANTRVQVAYGNWNDRATYF